MKHFWFTSLRMLMIISIPGMLYAQVHTYHDAWSAEGFTLSESTSAGVSVDYSVKTFTLEKIEIDGQEMNSVLLTGAFLFNEAGAPNLPGYSRYIAIPQGAVPRLNILSLRIETIENVEVAPAPVIPKDDQPGPLVYQKNNQIYHTDALYPAEPVMLGTPGKIRGVDVVLLGVTPFQYNPVTKKLIVYRDLKIRITFEGGNGNFGDNRLRSRWWDPILEDAIFNYASLPVMDYSLQQNSNTDIPGYEYLIICPNGNEFQQWADSIRRFRQQQGITTTVKTLTDVGGNSTTAIENYINTAYNTWTPPPSAVLLLGDYGTNANSSVISPIYNSYCVSDNIYGDVGGDHLPDICMARITANNATQLQVMCSKFLNYERNPPTSAYFYGHPITALGWQTVRWFQICSESVGGFWNSVQGKTSVRINEIYVGNPSVDPWSTATNTSMVLNYFGPNGQNYIPATPQQMPCCWTGGSATQINNAINAGAFCLLHRDHGGETGWGEPAYNNSNINGLTNTGLLSFIFSINCLTGKYNWSNECFTEKFHRYTYNGQNAGALGLIAASEVSYSFVNDTYLWGMMDNFWTNFMPTYGTNPASRGFLPCFGNAAGKYFLQQSNWPYNTSNKEVTYHLFHHHGDAFSVVYSEVPVALTVVHNSSIMANQTQFQVTANAGSFICMSLNDEIHGTANGTGSPVTINLPGTQTNGQYMRITVTKQNFFRYSVLIPVIPNGGPMPDFTADSTQICAGQSVDYTDMTSGNPTSWNWSFPGGNPSTSTLQHPQNIFYNNPGTYNVTLTATNSVATNSYTKTNYITVSAPAPTPPKPSGDTLLCENSWNTMYTIPQLSGVNSYDWTLIPDSAGTLTETDTSAVVDWDNTFHGYAYIKVQAINGCGASAFSPELAVHIRPNPAQPAQPQGQTVFCAGPPPSQYTTNAAPNTSTYIWNIEPSAAGSITGLDTIGTVTWNSAFAGTAVIKVQGSNQCNTSPWSDPLEVTIQPFPVVSLGDDTTLVVTETLTLDAGNPGAAYVWSNGNTTQSITVGFSGNWNDLFWVEVTMNNCSSTDTILVSWSDPVNVPVIPGNPALKIFPNPGNGFFRVELTTLQGPAMIRIVNVLGNTVFESTALPQEGKFNGTINLGSLPAGMYEMKVTTNQGVIQKKLIIRK